MKDKHEILGEIVGGGVPDAPINVIDAPYCELSKIGQIVDSRIQEMNNLYNDLEITKYIIMPNHIHMIVCIVNSELSIVPESGSSGTPTPTNAKIPSFISTLKRYTNKECGFSFWQRSYHDRIIRDEEEYNRIWKYIDENPLNWDSDEYFCIMK
ncbi:MAG: transposase [Oscillospiraceae bacterium]|nr:transposase [Oscillospiraceae bacterium]